MTRRKAKQNGVGGPLDGANLRELLFASARDAIVVADDNRVYVDANPAACELFGVAPGGLMGRHIEEFALESEGGDIADSWSEFVRGGNARGEIRVRRADGSIRWVEYFARANFAPGLHVAFLRDATERRLALALDEAEHALLAQMVEGSSPSAMLATICAALDEQLAGSHASILVVDGETGAVEIAVGPSLPGDALEAAPVRPVRDAGGAFLEVPIGATTALVSDVASHPRWATQREALARLGLRGCWTKEIEALSGARAGVIQIYRRELQLPTSEQWRLVERAARLAAVAFEWRRAEQALEAAEARFKLLSDNTSDTVMTLSPSGVVTFASPSIRRLLGYDLGRLVGESVFLPVHDDDVVALRSMHAELVERHTPVTGTVRVRRADGIFIWVDVSTRPVLDETTGKVVEIVAVLRDATGRVRAETERDRLHADAQRNHRESSLVLMATGFAHHVNNHLVGILGNAQLLAGEQAHGGPQAVPVEQITEAANAIADLMQQLMAFCGTSVSDPKPVNLTTLVREMSGVLEPLVDSRSKLHFVTSEALPDINADVNQLRQVVLNLVRNAAEAIADGDGHVMIRTGLGWFPRVALDDAANGHALKPGRYVYLQVVDSGCGIDPEVRSRAFEAFFTTKEAGRGLGLSAALGIVREHGGAIFVEGRPARLTTFTVVLPPYEHEALEPAVVAPVAEIGHAFGATVLIADDEPTVRRFVERFLTSEGYTVYVASSGSEAVELFRRHADTIDLLLLDVNMPGMSGDAVYERVREDRPDVRVVFMSGFNKELALGRMEADRCAFLQKPFQLRELLALLNPRE